MTQLYTVTFSQMKKVSRFDTKGNKISDTVELIPVTMRDLPLQTAQMYKRTQKYGTCEITPQAPSTGERERRYDRGNFSTRSKSGSGQSKKPAKQAARPAPASSLQEAARTGDMSAAINAGE